MLNVMAYGLKFVGVVKGWIPKWVWFWAGQRKWPLQWREKFYKLLLSLVVRLDSTWPIRRSMLCVYYLFFIVIIVIPGNKMLVHIDVKNVFNMATLLMNVKERGNTYIDHQDLK